MFEMRHPRFLGNYLLTGWGKRELWVNRGANWGSGRGALLPELL